MLSLEVTNEFQTTLPSSNQKTTTSLFTALTRILKDREESFSISPYRQGAFLSVYSFLYLCNNRKERKQVTAVGEAGELRVHCWCASEIQTLAGVSVSAAHSDGMDKFLCNLNVPQKGLLT